MDEKTVVRLNKIKKQLIKLTKELEEMTIEQVASSKNYWALSDISKSLNESASGIYFLLKKTAKNHGTISEFKSKSKHCSQTTPARLKECRYPQNRKR